MGDGVERVNEARRGRELAGGVRLEPFVPGFTEDYLALVRANREHLGRWMTWVWRDVTTEAAREQIAVDAEAPNKIRFVVMHEGRVIGQASLFGISDFLSRAEVEYWLAEDSCGHGITTTVLRALCRLAFDELGLQRVELHASVENVGSRRVADKCGFVLEGVLRRGWRVRDEFHDLAVYSRLATDPEV